RRGPTEHCAPDSVAPETDTMQSPARRSPGSSEMTCGRDATAREPGAACTCACVMPLDASRRGWHACAPSAAAFPDDRSATCRALAGPAAAAPAHRRVRPGALRPLL